MTYTLEIWQEQAAEKLAQAGKWLERRREDVPSVVYGTLWGKKMPGDRSTRAPQQYMVPSEVYKRFSGSDGQASAGGKEEHE